jgi:hypothetical protein
MSAHPSRIRRRAGALLVRLYPAAWRARYGGEILPLIEDDPPGARGLVSLLAGAADAHLRPRASWQGSIAPAAQTRLSVCGVFCCWIALSLMGAGFQQETEDGPFSVATAHHPLLGLARAAILAGAALGALSIAIGGLPLVWQACRSAFRERDRRLVALLALPLVAAVSFRGLTALLVTTAPARHGHFLIGFVLTASAPWMLGGILCALVCALAPRLVLARANASVGALRRASIASLPLAVAMALVTGGLLAYAVDLLVQAPAVATLSSGPVGASTGAMLATQALLASPVAALGVVGALRARRAAAEMI